MLAVCGMLCYTFSNCKGVVGVAYTGMVILKGYAVSQHTDR